MTNTLGRQKDSPPIEALKERMERDPFSRAFLQLSEEFRRLGRFKEAVQVCLEGLSRHPTYHTARIALGRTYLEAGDLQAARRTLQEVFEAMPENHLAGKLLAQVQSRLGEREAAAETCRGVLIHYPGDKEIESLLGEMAGAAAPADGMGPARPAATGPAGNTGPGSPPSGGVPGEAPAHRAEPLPGSGHPSPDLPPGRIAGRAGRAEGDGGDVFQTNTLAELYLRQGLVEKAVEVYRGMLRVDPGNTAVRRRLEDLVPGSTQSLPPGDGAARAAMPPEPPAPPASLIGVDPPAPAPGALAAARLRRWLASIQTGTARAREARAR